MELWRELLVSGLQDESYKLNCIGDNTLKKIIKDKCYKALLGIKQVIDDEKLKDEDCFIKIEEIICKLVEDGIFCDRHDFG